MSSLTSSEERQIIDLLERLSNRQREAVLASEQSFSNWLRRAASWLWDKITSGLIGAVIGWLWGLFF